MYITAAWKKSFVHEARSKPPEIRDNTLCLCHAHLRTDGPVVTVMYTGQNLQLNAFWLGLKNISLSNRLDNGQEQKIIFFLPLFGMACNLSVALNTDTRSVAFR